MCSFLTFSMSQYVLSINMNAITIHCVYLVFLNQPYIILCVIGVRTILALERRQWNVWMTAIFSCLPDRKWADRKRHKRNGFTEITQELSWTIYTQKKVKSESELRARETKEYVKKFLVSLSLFFVVFTLKVKERKEENKRIYSDGG